MPGDIIDRYQLGRLLGEGRFGVVMTARHLVTGREVAIKGLKEDAAVVHGGSPMHEAMSVAAISHPNVVEILDAGTSADGMPFLVFERLNGHTLRHELHEGNFTLHRFRRLARQLLSALAHMHSQRMVHLDVKPENIFVVSDGGRERLKLLDFGISCALKPDGVATVQSDLMLGTPRYMSPEQSEINPVLDRRSDVFSASIVFYEMFVGSALASVALKSARTPGWERHLARSQGVPDGIWSAIMRGLAADPDARWPCADEYARALGLQASTRPTPPSQATQPRARPLESHP